MRADERSWQPVVSVVLAVRDEARALPACLEALARQTYPLERLDVIVADGCSRDGGAEFARAAARTSAFSLRVIDNPARLAPAGFNAGIRLAQGEVIIILGGRAEVAPDFVAESVAALARTGADAVGGVVESLPTDARRAVARAVALALRSPFGVGDARYRYATEEREADTVNYGAYRRVVFERIGLFDEALVWVEDDELNYRLRKAGGRLVLSPRIRVRYTARATLGALWRQQFRWGLNKPKVARRHPVQMRPRHAVPALFVATVTASVLASPWLRPARWLLASTLGVYGAASLLATQHALRREQRQGAMAGAATMPHSATGADADGGSLERAGMDRGEIRPGRAALSELGSRWRVALALPAAFATMHLAYGTGMLLGLTRTLVRREPLTTPPALAPRETGVAPASGTVHRQPT